MRRLLRRVRDRLRRGRIERDIADEIRHHLELETELLHERGLPPGEARRRARMRFGSVEGVTEELRGVHGLGWVDDALRDGAVAVRGFARRPGLPAAVALTLALGIGAGTVVTAAVRAILLDAPPYADADGLVFVWRTDAAGRRLRVPGPDAAEVRARVPQIRDLAFLARVAEVSVARAGGAALPVRAALASANWFAVLGVEPALGRGFQVEDGQPGAETVWLLDDAFFRGRLGADSSLLGGPLVLDGIAGTVIGVLPAGFRLLLPPGTDVPTDVQVWQPWRGDLAALRRPDRETDQDSDDTGIVVARLQDGAQLGTVQDALGRVSADLHATQPAYAEAGWELEVRALRPDLIERARPVLRAVGGAVLLVLLLATANAAGLLLTRAVARSRELAVRVALGARGGRIARQIVIENSLLVAAGALAGLMLAAMLLNAIAPRLATLAPVADVRLDALVIGFVALLGLAVTAATSAAVLLDPSLRLSTSSLLVTRGATGFGRGARRLRSGLVALQVAVSLALVAGSAVMVRTAGRLAGQDLGFRATNVLAFRIGMAFPDSYRGPAERAALVVGLEAAMLSLPGVEAVGLVGGLPLADPEFTQPWAPAGTPASEWGRLRANYRVVTAGWFATMGTQVLEGRAFRPEDDRQDRRVVIVDAKLAGRLAPGGSAVGRAVRVPVDGNIVEATIVGVVEDVRFESVEEPGRETLYVPYRHEASRRVAFVVRTRAEPGSFARPIAEAIAAVDPRIAMHDARPLSAVVDETLRPARDVMRLLTAFACAALLLAVVALHAAVAYGVQRRTAEIGLRLALGASPGQVVAQAMRAGLVPCAAGLAGGLLLVLAGAPVLRGMVYGVSPLDPVLLAGATVSIGFACVLACRIAARRAARIPPGVALSGMD